MKNIIIQLTIYISYHQIILAEEKYNIVENDGRYEFGYDTPDSYHYADANRHNIVKGEFGARSPTTGKIDATIYTAGPRGYRPRGKNIIRKYDLNQNQRKPITDGTLNDPYFDPNEDPSYQFNFNTRTYTRQEMANRFGDVTGKYTYLDDVGEQHNVEFIAGKNTGFHVRTPFPDSNPRSYGSLYFNGRGKPLPRGRTSIQHGLDGSYKFVTSGPDQRRTEQSDNMGHVRGSYTYLDDKGIQHSVHYIAGPETGYRIIKNVKGPHLPTLYPFQSTNFFSQDQNISDLFDTAASGHIKPSKPLNGFKPDFGVGIDLNNENFQHLSKPIDIDGINKPFKPNKPIVPPSIGSLSDDDNVDDDTDINDDLFGPTNDHKPNKNKPKPTNVPPSKPTGFIPTYIPPPSASNEPDDGSYKPTGDDGSYEPIHFPDKKPHEPTLEVDGNNCERCKGTIVTNTGDQIFSVPPGVSVRAHVQAISLQPIKPKIPSPNEQYEMDIKPKTEQLNAVDDLINYNQTNDDLSLMTTTDLSIITTTLSNNSTNL